MNTQPIIYIYSELTAENFPTFFARDKEDLKQLLIDDLEKYPPEHSLPLKLGAYQLNTRQHLNQNDFSQGPCILPYDDVFTSMLASLELANGCIIFRRVVDVIGGVPREFRVTRDVLPKKLSFQLMNLAKLRGQLHEYSKELHAAITRSDELLYRPVDSSSIELDKYIERRTGIQMMLADTYRQLDDFTAWVDGVICHLTDTSKVRGVLARQYF